jgi:hypothetical protein
MMYRTELVFSSRYNEKIVMPGLVPGIHVFLIAPAKQDVDGRDIQREGALRAFARPWRLNQILLDDDFTKP